MQKGEKDLGVGQTWNLLATSSRFLCLKLVAVDSNRGLMLLLLFFSTSFTFLRDSLVSSILLHYSLWSLLLPQSAEHPLAAAAEVLYDWAIHDTKVRRRLCDVTTLIYDYTYKSSSSFPSLSNKRNKSRWNNTFYCGQPLYNKETGISIVSQTWNQIHPSIKSNCRVQRSIVIILITTRNDRLTKNSGCGVKKEVHSPSEREMKVN